MPHRGMIYVNRNKKNVLYPSRYAFARQFASTFHKLAGLKPRIKYYRKHQKGRKRIMTKRGKKFLAKVGEIYRKISKRHLKSSDQSFAEAMRGALQKNRSLHGIGLYC